MYQVQTRAVIDGQPVWMPACDNTSNLRLAQATADQLNARGTDAQVVTVPSGAVVHTGKPGPQNQASKEMTTTESRTYYVIQMWSAADPQWVDVPGQLTAGYPTLADARQAVPAVRDWETYKQMLGCEVKVRVVERTITEIAFEV